MSEKRMARGWAWCVPTLLVAGVLLPVPNAIAITPKAATSVSPQAFPQSGQPLGVNTSASQHENDVAIDWSAVKGAGKSFAFLKATEGETTDPWFARDLAGAAAAGLSRAPVHRLSGGDTLAESNYFLQQIHAAGYTGDQPGELPPVIELLPSPGGGCRYSAADVMTFADNVRAQTGRLPILYVWPEVIGTCFSDIPALDGLWLWKYDLTGIDGPPMNAPWTFWHYDDDNTVPGITGYVGLDAYFAFTYSGPGAVPAMFDGMANIGHASSLSGDRKADITAVQPNGDIIAWRNAIGFANSPWEPDSVLAGSGLTDGTRVRYAEASRVSRARRPPPSRAEGRHHLRDAADGA